MKKITVLIPAYNESQNLPYLHAKLDEMTCTAQNVVIEEGDSSMIWTYVPEDYEWEFLIVNDGSTDGTQQTLQKLHKNDYRVNYLSLTRNFGKENAMLAGMDYATGDAVIIMDADLQDPVDLIPEMIYYWEQGYDDVYGKRGSRGKESWLRKRMTMSFYRFLQKSSKVEILPNVGDFRLIDRRMINAIKELRETQRYTKGLFCWVGYKKKELIFDRNNREKGKSSFRIGSLMNLAIEGITSFTTAPLRLATVLGFVVSLLALVFMLYIFFKTIIYGDPVQGFPALMCVILFLGGVQLIGMGIIGEYIGRIFNETKNRPPYIADSFNDKKI